MKFETGELVVLNNTDNTRGYAVLYETCEVIEIYNKKRPYDYQIQFESGERWSVKEKDISKYPPTCNNCNSEEVWSDGEEELICPFCDI